MLLPTRAVKRIAVVGAGPAGLATATAAAERGHEVQLFEADGVLGGQFNLARQIPGKEEFAETIRYFTRRLELTGVKVTLNHLADAAELLAGGFDEIVLATGVTPRVPDIPGIDLPFVHPYPDVIGGRVEVGERVAVIGAGGIGVDVSEFLTANRTPGTAQAREEWMREWGVGDPERHRGGLVAAEPGAAHRQVFLLQRKTSRIGAGLGRTSGWVHRAALKAYGVEGVSGVQYQRIDTDGVHVRIGNERRVIAVDDVVVCAGQESRRDLAEALRAGGATVHLVGGADVASELDAKRAIGQGTRLAAGL